MAAFCSPICSHRCWINCSVVYYPGGMMMPGRTFSAGNYAYGFNGKRKDNEIYGEGNAYDFGARIYDPRIVRLFSLDPLMKKFPDESNYSFASGNPISNIDVDGEKVTWWYTLWRHKEFKTLIVNLKKTDVFQTIFKRFIQNQDNVVIKPTARGYFGFADPARKANGYVLDLGFNGFMNGDNLTADPTFIAKVILHEGIHDKNGLVHAEGGDANYPTLDRHMKKQATTPGYEGEHEAMAEGNVNYLVKGMKQFDKANGTGHSGEWYNAMTWFGSLQRATDDWKNMNPTKKANYQSIIDNEQDYMGYLNAKATYMNNKTAANKTTMSSAKSNVDWKLFKKTRTK